MLRYETLTNEKFSTYLSIQDGWNWIFKKILVSVFLISVMILDLPRHTCDAKLWHSLKSQLVEYYRNTRSIIVLRLHCVVLFVEPWISEISVSKVFLFLFLLFSWSPNHHFSKVWQMAVKGKRLKWAVTMLTIGT